MAQALQGIVNDAMTLMGSFLVDFGVFLAVPLAFSLLTGIVMFLIAASKKAGG